jgi:protein gp37
MSRQPLDLDPPAIVRPADEMATLAAEINRHHEAGEASRRRGLEHFLSAGKALLRAKARCPHGQWGAWVKKHLRFHERTAHRYIAIAKSDKLSDLEGEWHKIQGRAAESDSEDGSPDAAVAPDPPPPDYLTLEQWNALDKKDRDRTLQVKGDSKFNDQGDSEGILWALWSWNPVTGCRHNCPYCYARDIAERFYPQKFVPSLWPGRLKAPHNTPFPKNRIEAEQEPWKKRGLGNVFVCSMADLFGRWVPREWIEAVLNEVRAAPQWNFLFLTKFPIRMAEFDFPENAWVGTTVDCQARVANAERSFAKVKAGVKWLSIEPMIEPLRFQNLSAFNWAVLGGASRSAQTPEWHPPESWIQDFRAAASKAGVLVYEKPNLHGDPIRQYPGDEPYLEPAQAPAELRYLPEVEKGGNP